MRLPSADSPFQVLCRAFFAQFFTSELVTSDVQLRRTLIWVMAFLILPCVYFVVIMLPGYEITVLVAKTRNAPWLVENLLVQLAFVFVNYSTVTIGFIAVFAWDALSFDRRDAMVLGPLPLRGPVVIGAKLAALAILLLGAASVVNVLAAIPYTVVTANHRGAAAFWWHFAAHLTATMGAATFIFAVIVTIRGLVALAGGARLAAGVGSLLQFVFVSALLCFFLVPAVQGRMDLGFVGRGSADWIPTLWFLGLFERLRGSARSEFIELSRRALLATPIAVAGAVAVSVMGFRRQMRLALVPSASTGPLGGMPVRRRLARWIAGHRAAARATTEFILLTISRNRPQQAPIAINAAIGLAIVMFTLSRYTSGLESVTFPRLAVLWIPLVLAYWVSIGMRASFFVPSELPASWTFGANAPGSTSAYWAATRASMIAFVVPPALAFTFALLVPLMGWRVAAWHAAVVCAVVTLMAEVMTLTVDHIPFTRAYRPGHARLKTRWPLYLLGMFAFAHWPVRFELRRLDDPASLLRLITVFVALIAVLEVAGRWMGRRWSVQPSEEAEEESEGLTVLDIGRVAPAAHQ